MYSNYLASSLGILRCVIYRLLFAMEIIPLFILFQFEDVVLDVAFYLLEQGVKIKSRDTAVKVGRLISSKVCLLKNLHTYK